MFYNTFENVGVYWFNLYICTVMIEETINKLIPLLDEDVDHLLISLLEQKIKSEYDSYLEKYKFTDKELLTAKKRYIGQATLNVNEIAFRSKRYQKIARILDNRDCYMCKHADAEYIGKSKYSPDGYFYNPSLDNFCNICAKRCDALSDVKAEYRNIRNVIYKQLFDDDSLLEIIKCKLLLSKINKKLKEIKNYETSEH